MGNSHGSQLNDDGMMDNAAAKQHLHHFEHSFKGCLFQCSGALFASSFGEVDRQEISIELTCKGVELEIKEADTLSVPRTVIIGYQDVSFLLLC
jgi:hypothetical protein